MHHHKPQPTYQNDSLQVTSLLLATLALQNGCSIDWPFRITPWLAWRLCMSCDIAGALELSEGSPQLEHYGHFNYALQFLRGEGADPNRAISAIAWVLNFVRIMDVAGQQLLVLVAKANWAKHTGKTCLKGIGSLPSDEDAGMNIRIHGRTCENWTFMVASSLQPLQW